MPINFKSIQSEFPDAIDLKINLVSPSAAFGQEQMCRFAGGGKVLYYEQKGKRERIIVSKIAECTKITIIFGPQGSGKSHKAREILQEYQPSEIAHFDTSLLREGECIVAPETKVIYVDEFPACAQFNLLNQRFINADTGKTLHVRVIACVQWDKIINMIPFHNRPCDHIQIELKHDQFN